MSRSDAGGSVVTARSSDPETSRAARSAGLLNGDPVAHSAAIRPGRKACIDAATGFAVTYAELDCRIAQCTGLLLDLAGRQERPRVAALARNSIDQIVLAFACQRAGAIFVPLNWRLAVAELQALMEDCTPSLLVFGDEFADAARSAAALIPRLEVMPFDGENGLARRIGRSDPAGPVAAAADDPCAILYTSGTTGRPKGVIVTRRNAFFAALDFALLGEVGSTAVSLLDVPLFHTIGLIAVCRSTLMMGGTLVVSDRFAPARTLAILSDAALGVTHYFGVPQIAAALRNDPAYAGADLSRLHAFFVGGAPLGPALAGSFLDDGVRLINGYGMSEAGSVLHMPIDAAAVRANPGSIGLPAPLLDLRIVDRGGNDVAVRAVGELWLRGPAVTPGYWNKPAETNAAFVDGWYRTGDLVRREENGFYHLVDRLKDMFISGGENVYPAEIEAVLLSHPGVLDAAVIGIAEPRWGEAGLAFVVPRPGAAVAEAELIGHCTGRLARYKRPQRIVFVEQIPRTASGKALKHQLRQLHLQQESAPERRAT
jgi:fatty-acyl-CoA synthase